MEGPQAITRNGRKIAIVVSVEERQRKAKRKGNPAEFLLASPLRGSEIKFDGLGMRLRDEDF